MTMSFTSWLWESLCATCTYRERSISALEGDAVTIYVI